VLKAGERTIDLNSPLVMGILNATPDSFSDGGILRSENESGVFFISIDKALAVAQQMISDGAAIIDVGGESTRPGAVAVSVQEELDRVIPVVEALTDRLGALVSVDTSTPQVMAEAASKGAVMVNDVRALRREGARSEVARSGLAACLMHMQGEPDHMQLQPHYEDVVAEVFTFLERRVAECVAAGVAKESLIVDPGFGFGKTLEQNYTLLRNLDHFRKIGVPLLVGISRKSMIGNIVNRPAMERMSGSLAAACFAVLKGADIIRTHDVAATVDAIKVFKAIHSESPVTKKQR
jgi:dihydropteroate synthase